MAIERSCPHCQTVHTIPELNDDVRIDPPVRLGQIVHFRDEQFKDVPFRVLHLDKMQMLLEKVG